MTDAAIRSTIIAGFIFKYAMVDSLALDHRLNHVPARSGPSHYSCGSRDTEEYLQLVQSERCLGELG
jgi:hypothetical protein